MYKIYNTLAKTLGIITHLLNLIKWGIMFIGRRLLFFRKRHWKEGVDMYPVYDVARWFLSKEAMTHKKLQKLCYYAQAWHYTLLKEPLFSEEIQAWVHGPVIPALYPTYADYKWNPIDKCEFSGLFSDDTLSVLETVYDTYGSFSGDQLERLTHFEEPWQKARKDIPEWEISTNAISLADMESYYSRIFKDSQND